MTCGDVMSGYTGSKKWLHSVNPDPGQRFAPSYQLPTTAHQPSGTEMRRIWIPCRSTELGYHEGGYGYSIAPYGRLPRGSAHHYNMQGRGVQDTSRNRDELFRVRIWTGWGWGVATSARSIMRSHLTTDCQPERWCHLPQSASTASSSPPLTV